MDLLFDPLFVLTVRASIALLFASALVHKIQSFEEFEGSFSNYLQGMGIRRRRWVRQAAGLVILIEGLTVILCLWPTWNHFAGLLSALVLLSYAAAMGVNLARGHALPDCGCSWGKMPQQVGMPLVVRNLILAGVALSMTVPTTGRSIGALDMLSALFALIVAATAYAAINQLMALTTLARGDAI